MTTILAYTLDNWAGDVMGWTDPGVHYAMFAATSAYVWDSGQTTFPEAISAGLFSALVLDAGLDAAGRTASGDEAFTTDLSGITHASSTPGTIEAAGEVTQLLIVRDPGGDNQICAQIDLPEGVTISLTDTIGVSWSGAVWDIGSTAFAPTITGGTSGGGGGLPPFTEPDYPISVSLYDSTNTTLVGALTTTIVGSRQWQDVLNDLGSAGLQVPLRVPNEDRTARIINPESTALARGQVLRFGLNGTERFSAIIRPRKQVSIAEASKGTAPDSSQLREVTCQGLLSDWQTSCWFPSPGTFDFDGADTRHLGWMGPETDISGLDTPTTTRNPFAETHPDPILDQFGVILDAGTYRYFLLDYTPDHDMETVTQMTAWDTFQWWLQSTPAGTGATPPASSKAKMYHGTASLRSGITYRFAWDVQGLPSAPETGLLASAWEILDPEDGNINAFNGDDNLFRTSGTDFGWKASVDPLGITAKKAIRIFLTEAQARGRLTDWTINGSDDSLDENGNTFDLIPDLPVQIGMKGGDWLLKMAATWCDLEVSVAGKTLYIYRWGERGTFHSNPDPGPAPIYAGLEYGRAFADDNDGVPNLAGLNHEERVTQ